MKHLLLLSLSLLTACGGGGGSASSPAVIPALQTSQASSSAVPFAVIGDSISQGYNPGGGWVNDESQAWPTFASAMTGRPVTILAKFGAIEPDMANGDVPLIPPNVTTVVYAGGTNDVAHGLDEGLTQTTLLARIDDMVTRIHAQVPNAKIVLLNVRRFVWAENPNTDAWAQAWDAHERSLGYPVVDIENVHPEANGPGANAYYPDGIHPSPMQAQALAAMVAPTIR